MYLHFKTPSLILKSMELETLLKAQKDVSLRRIGEKVLEGKRLNPEEALTLFNSNELAYIGTLAEFVNRQKNGGK
jgi:aminodeoxyfutalosine synthase